MPDSTLFDPEARLPATAFDAWSHERTALLQGLLDALSRPAAVLSADRALIAVSHGAGAELQRCLVVCDGRVGGFTGMASERFEGAFARALIGCRCEVAVLPRGAERPWRVQFTPLACPAWLNSNFLRAAVLATIDMPRERCELKALARLYRLTNAETRVLTLLLEGRATAEIAAEMRIAMNTVRTHLKALFQKTNTRRQTQLIRLAAQLASV